MISKLLAIAHNTFVETIRQPIYGILIWVAAALLVINPSIAAFSLESGGDNKILKDVALSTLLLYGLFASVFSASGVVTREIESYTVLTVVSKPVSRPLFISGKFLGVAGAMLVGFYFLCLVFLMTVRHGVMEAASDKYDMPVLVLSTIVVAVSLLAATFGNFNYGWHFSTTLTAWVVPLGTIALGVVLFFDREWKPQHPMTDFGDMQMIYACMLIFMAVMIQTAFAVALSTRFSQVMTLTLCAGVFLLGLLSDYYFGLRADQAPLYAFMAAILPNFQFFWLGDAITQELGVTGQHIARVAGYAATYTGAVLCLAIALFQTREVG